jgi:hypothetical protein
VANNSVVATPTPGGQPTPNVPTVKAEMIQIPGGFP